MQSLPARPRSVADLMRRDPSPMDRRLILRPGWQGFGERDDPAPWRWGGAPY